MGKAQGPREIPYFARAQFSTSAVPCITTIFSKKASSKGCLEPPTLYSTIQSTHSSTIHHSTIPYIRGQCELKILSFTCNRTQLAPQPTLSANFTVPHASPPSPYSTPTHIQYCAVLYSTVLLGINYDTATFTLFRCSSTRTVLYQVRQEVMKQLLVSRVNQPNISLSVPVNKLPSLYMLLPPACSSVRCLARGEGGSFHH